MSQTMRAWQISAPGPLDSNLKLVDDAAKPSQALKTGEILVEVESAGINPADYKVPELGLVSKAAISYPKTPGMDLSGHVRAVADDVTDTKPGDAILGRLDPASKAGSLSQYVVLSRDGYASLPADGDLDQAAGASTGALTAYQTIKPYIKEGDHVFINGGSGGVGTFAIQVAKLLGCHVTVTCSTAKADLCRKLGADQVIDYKQEDVLARLKEMGQVFHHAVDCVGDSPPGLFDVSHEYLIPKGHYVHVGGGASMKHIIAMAKGLFLPGFLGGGKRKFLQYLTKNSRDDLSQIARWLAEKKLETVIESVYNFEEGLKAYQHLKKGSCAGKIIVHIAAK